MVFTKDIGGNKLCSLERPLPSSLNLISRSIKSN